MNTSLDKIIKNNHYESGIEVCPGCENHCTVKTFRFDGGRTFHSGNQCERIYGSDTEIGTNGVNMFVEKNRLLWNRSTKPVMPNGIRIGLPRGLGIYEDFPFWCTLLTACGFEVVLSKSSTNRLYEQGIRSVMADNICFPAKLMHGHILDLIDRHVDRILYPWVVFEHKEDSSSGNSYNCPIVSGYSDVLRSALNPEESYGIPLDAPVINFKDSKLLEQSITEYLATLGVASRKSKEALRKAVDAQERYLAELERRSQQVLQQAIVDGRTVILLAARPYHIDPLIEHKVSQAIADMGIDVITENVASHAGSDVYSNINALSQWAYPNRIFKAAWFTGRHPYANLHMVELTSFGCGPDAFILDEVRSILDRHHRNLTVLKIDDVNNIGSLKLRIRSLVESAAGVGYKTDNSDSSIHHSEQSTSSFTTAPFMPEDRRRTIIAPYFAEGYSEYLPTLFGMIGYRLECLPMADIDDAEQGLREANNDICYPATIVVGSIIRALKSGRYDLKNTAVAITQTGGQCRASNYYSLIKNAMVRNGFADVPVISVAMGGLQNDQPGFSIPWLKVWRIALYTMLYADTLQKLYYPAAAREVKTGEARRLFDHYTAAAQPIVAAQDYRRLLHLLAEAVEAFTRAIDCSKNIQRVGLVGEIYVKYNSFSNKHVADWLMEHGVEVVPPALTPFFLKYFATVHADKRLNIRRPAVPTGLLGGAESIIQNMVRKFDRVGAAFPFYRPFEDVHDIYRLSTQVVNPAANFGEGWYLPGEICHLAESGIDKVVSVQPFGCIANHIISKGIEKRLKERYPNLSLLFLDFDSGTSEANVHNRLHFMLS